MVYPTKDKAVKDIALWIELRYNHVRLHSALGYRTFQRGRTRFPGLNKGSLKHKTSTVRKTPSSPGRCVVFRGCGCGVGRLAAGLLLLS